MRFGIVGLGRMGANLARLAIEKGHGVVGYNKDPAPTRELAGEGFEHPETLPRTSHHPVRSATLVVVSPRSSA